MIKKDKQPREDDQHSGKSRTIEYPLSDAEPGLLVRPEVRPGRFPGNERVRFVLPRKPALRRVRRGVLEATAVTQNPTNAWGRVKRMLIGSPIPTSRSEHERLTKFKALAVLSSDAISSAAYATEAILATLIVAGSVNLGLTLLIIVGALKSFFVQHNPVIGRFQYIAITEPLSIFLILRSFAAGCSAMTGVEAISNGIPAFKKPETRNAAITLTWMAVILGTLFIGTTVLAMSYHIEANPAGNPTVIGQIAQQVFTGPLFFMYPVFQIATLLILTLAANTSYSDFPRLASLLPRDHFLPHQFAFRGDRLAFSIGIMFLAVLASLLLIVFKGDTTSLINLYAVGVFLSFTLSQSGMVRHWWRLRNEHKGWQRSLAINGLGAATTLLVAAVIASTKFLEGAWIVVVLIPLLVAMFLAISLHYQRVERERTTEIPIHPKDIQHRLIVPIAELNVAAKQSLAYARSISSHVTAIHVAIDRKKTNNQ